MYQDKVEEYNMGDPLLDKEKPLIPWEGENDDPNFQRPPAWLTRRTVTPGFHGTNAEAYSGDVWGGSNSRQ